jgi:molybdopterin converting factor small subunit
MPRPVVRVHLFAGAREAVGLSVLEWPVPEGGLSAHELVRQLGERYPAVRRTLRTSRFVRNAEFLPNLRRRIRPGDDFAVHPPYGGG